MSTYTVVSKEILVPQSHIALLYEDGAFLKVLAPGKHEFKKLFDKTTRMAKMVDTRERSLTIKGQEILTSDKVAIRVSLLVYFRVKDAVAAVHNVESYEERIYEDVQLAARRFLSSRVLDDILTDRNGISDAVRTDLTSTAATYGVEILRADVKDLVFPGNLREIMNAVIETERKGDAKLIEARRDAEAMRIRSEAEITAARAKAVAERERLALVTEGERERAKATTEAEADRVRLKLTAEVDEAKAIASNPQILELRRLGALTDMARTGAKFVVGLNGELGHALKD